MLLCRLSQSHSQFILELLGILKLPSSALQLANQLVELLGSLSHKLPVASFTSGEEDFQLATLGGFLLKSRDLTTLVKKFPVAVHQECLQTVDLRSNTLQLGDLGIQLPNHFTKLDCFRGILRQCVTKFVVPADQLDQVLKHDKNYQETPKRVQG